MKEAPILATDVSPVDLAGTRTLLVLPNSSGTSAAIDSVVIAASGLSDGLRSRLGPVDILTRDGLRPAAELKIQAVRAAATPNRARRIVRSVPALIRPVIGDVRAALRGYTRSGRADLDRSERYGLVIQFHHRFQRLGLDAARRMNVPFILRLEALEVREESAWGIRRPGFGGLIERFGELPTIRAADLVLPVSRQLDSELETLGIQRSHRLVLPNGVDVAAFSPGVPDRPLIHELGLDGRFLVGWIGGFRPFHGLAWARQIADGLAMQVPHAVLCLVGSGPEWKSIRSDLRDHENVRVIPAVPHREVPRWLRSFDACLLLASSGAFHYSPLKLFEYMACGRPVIAVRIGDIPLSASDGRDAVLVEPGDPRAVVRAVEMLATEYALRQRLASSARARAERTQSWDARAVSLVRALRERGLVS